MSREFKNHLLFAPSMAAMFTCSAMAATVHAALLQQIEEPTAAAILNSLDESSAPSSREEIDTAPVGTDALAPESIKHDFHHNVLLDQNGGFTGKLSTVSASGTDLTGAGSYTVKVIRRGEVIGETTTNAAGEFQFTGLQPGVVGIVAYSPQGLALYGCNLVQADPALAAAQAAVVNVSSTVITGRDAIAARQMLLAALSTKGRRFDGELQSGEDLFPMGGSQPSSSISNKIVQLSADGTFSGEVNIMDERTGRYREVHDLTVHVIRDGRQIAAASVESDGSFSISGMSPGVVAIVGTGMDGVFGVAITFVAAADNQTALNSPAGSDRYRPTSVVAGGGFAISPIGPGSLSRENISSVSQPGQPGVAGGFAGGGGGAGGIAGGGGLGALLTGIAAGIGGYYAGKDDDKPASPGN